MEAQCLVSMSAEIRLFPALVWRGVQVGTADSKGDFLDTG